IVEDSPLDTELVVRALEKGGYEPIHERVETADAMRAALTSRNWDIVFSDYYLPTFSAVDALKILQESRLDLPFIIVSGGVGEDTAAEAMRAGAHDYVMKGNLARLGPAVQRELREASNRESKREATEALHESQMR